MRIETFCPQTNWRDMVAAARAAETAGFDCFDSAEVTGDPFAPLALAALNTERIGLRTAIAVAFPRSPMVVANIAWDLQVNSRGRFTLGLGTQVKGHNERRFSVRWTAPGPRLREYVEALRAIWRCWELREPLNYVGKHYQFTLMTPEFSPPPSGLPPVPVYIAAVRPAMMRLAGTVCDGVRLHGFCTRRYLAEVALPELEAGLARSGRAREQFEICGGGFIATGPDEATLARGLEALRYRVAFYGSTRTYGPVLALHGWEDLNTKLHRLSKEGRWGEMAAAVPDEVLREFTAAATFDKLGGAIEQRFGGFADTVEIGFPPGTPVEQVREVLRDVRRIPARFTGYRGAWD
jgi:probable F420-dependent oxidoreductase